MSRNRSLPAGTALAVKLLSAYLARNAVAPQTIPGLIHATRKALVEAGPDRASDRESMVDHPPAVSVRESLRSPEHIVSMIDGKPYRILRRHLAAHGLTPEEYRSRYGLAADYPLVSPAYAAHRSALARHSGLGRKGSMGAPEIAEAQMAPEPSAPEPSAPEPIVPEPSAPEPLAPEPMAVEPPAISPPSPPQAADQAVEAEGGRNALPEALTQDSKPAARPRPKLSLFSRGGAKAEAQPDPVGDDASAGTLSEPAPSSGDQDTASERASPRLTVMEAITRRRAVSALYNGALVRLAPHLIFERRGDLFLAALNLSKNWRADEEKRLGQFKFAGLGDVKLLQDGVTPLPSYDGVPPRPEDLLILSI